MSETAQKCENYAIFKQIYNLELFLLLKWPIHVSDFLKKSFITSTTDLDLVAGFLSCLVTFLFGNSVRNCIHLPSFRSSTYLDKSLSEF